MKMRRIHAIEIARAVQREENQKRRRRDVKKKKRRSVLAWLFGG